MHFLYHLFCDLEIKVGIISVILICAFGDGSFNLRSLMPFVERCDRDNLSANIQSGLPHLTIIITIVATLCVRSIPRPDGRIIIARTDGRNEQSFSAGLDGWPEGDGRTIYKILGGEVRVPTIESSMKKGCTILPFNEQTNRINVILGIANLEGMR